MCEIICRSGKHLALRARLLSKQEGGVEVKILSQLSVSRRSKTILLILAFVLLVLVGVVLKWRLYFGLTEDVAARIERDLQRAEAARAEEAAAADQVPVDGAEPTDVEKPGPDAP